MIRYQCTECELVYETQARAAVCHWGIGGVVEIVAPDPRPLWATHPGELLRDVLADRRIKQTTLARAIGVTPKHLSQIITGHVRLTPRIAVRIETAIGVPAWRLAQMQAGYDVHAERIAAAATTKGEL